MIDKFIEYILKKNRPLGIILGGFIVIIFLVDVVNNFVQIGQLTSSPLWLPIGLVTSLIFGIAIGWDSEGYYSPQARKLARFLVLVSIQTLILSIWDFIGENFLSYENIFRWGFIVFVVLSTFLYFIFERVIQYLYSVSR